MTEERPLVLGVKLRKLPQRSAFRSPGLQGRIGKLRFGTSQMPDGTWHGWAKGTGNAMIVDCDFRSVSDAAWALDHALRGFGFKAVRS